MSQSGAKGQLAVDLSNKGAALLKRLQGEDDQISQLLCHASHSALYKYNPPEKTWERLGVEGPLVIVRRLSAPHTQMIILNRQSRDNYVIDVSTIIRTKSQDPYLMLQLMRPNGSKHVLGCWFYGSEEREQVRQVLEAVLEEAYKGNPTAAGASAGHSGSQHAARPAPTAAATGGSASAPTTPSVSADRASGQQILQLLRKEAGQRKVSPINASNNTGNHEAESKKKAGKPAAAPMSPIRSSPDELLTPSQVLGVPYKVADRAAATAAESSGTLSKESLRKGLQSLSSDDLFLDALSRRLNKAT